MLLLGILVSHALKEPRALGGRVTNFFIEQIKGRQEAELFYKEEGGMLSLKGRQGIHKDSRRDYWECRTRPERKGQYERGRFRNV